MGVVNLVTLRACRPYCVLVCAYVRVRVRVLLCACVRACVHVLIIIISYEVFHTFQVIIQLELSSHLFLLIMSAVRIRLISSTLLYLQLFCGTLH